MLSAIVVIGACVMVLAAVCGLLAVVLMLSDRLRFLFNALRECGFTKGAAREGFRAVVTDARTRPGSYLLGAAIFCSFGFFAEYILLGLVALGTLVTLFSAIGRYGRPGIEPRLARYLGYPLFAGPAARRQPVE